MARRKGHYYWRMPEPGMELVDGLLEEDGVDYAITILDSEERADKLIEKYDQLTGDDVDLGAAVLYKDGKKVKQGFDVLYEQQGLTDY